MYVWLVFVLMVITPNVVDFGEALATFLMFPVMLYVAYKLDVKSCLPRQISPAGVSGRGGMSSRPCALASAPMSTWAM